MGDRENVVSGFLPLGELAPTVNGLLAIQYPHHRDVLLHSRLVFMPESAQGALMVLPRMNDIPIRGAVCVKARLVPKVLIGVPAWNIGMRVSFGVAGGSLTIGRQERAISSPRTRANVLFAYQDGDPQAAAYERCLRSVVRTARGSRPWG